MSLLDVQTLSRHFGKLIAVDGVSLVVEPGELRAVIGPNGAGKTTFFNMLSGLFPPTSGKIMFDGQDVTAVPAQQRVKMGMARTFQITEIFPELSVRENLRVAAETEAGYRLRPWLGGAARRKINEDIAELLENGGLTAKSERLVGELSHGDQRATEIMMALALHPRLLLLDEPTAGMGDQETYDIAKLISRLHKTTGLACVLIEHDMRVVFNLADKITVLTEGHVLAEGTPKDIAGNEAVQAAYLGKSP